MSNPAVAHGIGRRRRAADRTFFTYVAIALASALLIANPFTVSLFYSRPGTAIYIFIFDLLLLLMIAASLAHLRSPAKLWSRAALGLMAGVPIVLVLTEFSLVFLQLRFPDWWSSEETTGLYTQNAQRGWSLQEAAVAAQLLPGGGSVTYELDELGRKLVPEQDPSLPTIHFFGNSFVFGQGVPNDQTGLNILAQRIGRSANVLNYGVPGYGIEQMFLYLAESLDQMRPGDTVVFAPIADDLRRNYIHRAHFCGYAIDDGDDAPGSFAFPAITATGWSFRQPSDECGFVETLLLKGTSFPVGRTFSVVRNKRLRAPLLANADEVFRRAEQAARDAEADFRVYLVATAEECARGRHDLDIQGLTTEHTSLLEACPPAAEDAASLRFAADYHWNESGNIWFADALERVLTEQGVLGK